jgi:ligand-binding sensor domain-containing protein
MSLRITFLGKWSVVLISASQLVACASSPVTLTSASTIEPAVSHVPTVAATTTATTSPATYTPLPRPTTIAVKATTPARFETQAKFDEQGVLYEYLADGTSQRVQPLIGDAGMAHIGVNGDGSIWFFTDQDVSRVMNGRITHFADERMAIEAAFPWTGTQTLWYVAPDGTIWTAADGQLIGYNSTAWSNVPLDGAKADTVEHIAAGPDGLLAITSASGLRVYTPETGWQVPPLPKNAPSDLWFGNDLLIGPDGSLWISLDFMGSGGLLHYIPASQTWTVFDEKNSDLPWIGITDLAFGPNGDMWVVNITKGILAIRHAKSGAWEYLAREPLFPDTYGFGGVYFGILGDLWLPTIGHCGENGDPCWQGLAHYVDGVWKRYIVADGLASDHVFAVAVDPMGVPWLITDVGLQRFEP